jgi:hypothetical protein
MDVMSSGDDLTQRLLDLEREIDGGHYRTGTWESFTRDLRGSSQVKRVALATDVSRVSRKLHSRHGYKTISLDWAISLEIAAAALGGILIAATASYQSNLAATAGALIWIVALQPIVKFSTGRALGIEYDYAYLFGPEPRLKMSYGSYLSASRRDRFILHLSGMVGSPFGAWMARSLMPMSLDAARGFCRIAMWLLIGINVALLLGSLAGIRRVGRLRMADSSGGAAALELREALAAYRGR